MRKRSMLSFAVVAIVGGCSRDAPFVAPQIEAVDAIVAPSVAVVSSVTDSADPVDDALGRLVPALDEHGTALRNLLLRMRANRSDRAALNELAGALDSLPSKLPARYGADLDALRLELGVATK